jgi:hypothetical protein
MQRREFLTAAATTAAAALALPASAQQPKPQPTAPADLATRQLPELRVYHFDSPLKQHAYEEFLAQSGIDAWNRAGIEPVGVFRLFGKDNPAPRTRDNPKPKETPDSTDLYVLLPHKTVGSMMQLEQRLALDEPFQKAGQAILRAPKSEPAYTVYESTLMRAFESVPQVTATSKSPDRLLQLRTYQSHSNERALKKIEMFEKGGELAIFRRCGMNPVFMGQSLAGAKLPNLTYMLAFDDQAAYDKGWKAFRDDPEWTKLSKDETYKDTVSTITNLILRPATRSQV